MLQEVSLSSRLTVLSRIGACIVALIGASAIVGWTLDIMVLKSLISGWTSMKANTAFAFLFAGLSLLLLTNPIRRWPHLPRILAGIVALIGGVTLTQYLFSISLGIDQLIFLDPPADLSVLHPGRMSPAGALSLLAAGLALLFLKIDRPRILAERSHWLIVPPLAISTVALIGYIFYVSSFYRVGQYTAMAANTAGTLLILSLSMMAADPRRGIAPLIVSDSAGGFLVRRLLPSIPIALIAVAWIRLWGEDAGYYDTRFGLALMVSSAILISVSAVALTGFRLLTIDKRRHMAEEGLIEANRDLELRVDERTRELQRSLEQVKQLTGMLPICAWCKNIRDDKDYWQSVEQYISHHTDAVFTHGICPDCYDKVLDERIDPTKLELQAK